jgi:hypothetical protein
MDKTRIDLVLQYAALVAGQEDDPKDRQLGPIHLIKYVYLADLEYAKVHNGKTFTGADWQFYNFGPWSIEVYQRIEPALLAAGALRYNFPSDYGDKGEWVRWELQNDKQLSLLARELPLIITTKINRFVHEFLTVTPDLLSYVYSTEPMLSAAPGEKLDLSLAYKKTEVHPKEVEEPIVLSARNMKKLKAGMEEIRKKARDRFEKKESSKRLVGPILKPIYDDIYFDGYDWLESQAGTPLPEGTLGVQFSPEIWKSQTRKKNDLP